MIPSTEENILDFINLANFKLKEKNKEIKDLKNIIYKPKLDYLKNIEKDKLRDLLSFYQKAGEEIQRLVDNNK